MEIVQQLGIQPVLLIAQIVNFLVIFFLLKRFLYKPIFSVLKKREETIKEGLAKAEEGRKIMEKALAEEREILRKAQKEARQIIEEARTQKDAIIKEAQEITKQQGEQLIAHARAQIAIETKEAEKQLASHISSLAVNILEKSLFDLFSEEEQDFVIKKAVQKMKGRVN